MKKRNKRHEAICDIVRTENIKTQHSLVERLIERGFNCTQATVSRDIAELDLRKLPEGIYVLAEDLHLQRMVSNLVVDVCRSNNLVIVKATPGSAPAVAAALDAADLSGVLGSIAGDDTLLVIVDNEENALSFERAVNKLRLV
ncbi:MAG: ArgR family transcriptional regulator [Actinobacteria bacterium]|nr:ArgR family transcriptional regulator [Actinomycetota bacterium]